MTDRSTSASSWKLAIAFAVAKLALHLVTAEGYGWFRDELYYLACADHLAPGYVDHPPLSIVALALWRAIFGDSLVAVRSLSALLGALNVLVVGRLTAEFGGGRYAQALAMLTIAVAPLHLALNHIYSMNAFDLLIWPVCAWGLVRCLDASAGKRWILLGACLGLGLLNKIGVAWLGAGFALGLLATPARTHLWTRWPWIAAALALGMSTPYVLWQVQHDWPTHEFIRNAMGSKMKAVSMLDFFGGQLEGLGLVACALAVVGLWRMLRGQHGDAGRVLAIAYLAVLALLLSAGTSRPGYLAPAYGWLVPAGAVWVERRLRGIASRTALVLVTLVLGVLVAPFAIPVLSVERFIAYARAAGRAPSTNERKELGALPQFYADMHGWQALAGAVERAYAQIPPPERDEVVVFTSNYGEAGAIDHFGRDRGLPPAVSGHNNYHLWGTRGRSASTMIVLGATQEQLDALFESVEPAGTFTCSHCMPYENGSPLWIVRGYRSGETLSQRWARLRHFD